MANPSPDPNTAMQMPRCAIVYGSLRSGTTMLRLMLDGHSQMGCSGEADFMFDHLRPVGSGWSYDRDALHRDFMYWQNPIRLADGVDGPEALADMIRKINGNDGIAILMLHRHMRRASDLLPGVPIIRLNRDPRDIAKSSIGMGWAGNVYFGSDHWVETQEEWDRFAAEHRDHPILDVRYENLVSDPSGELTRVCDFLGEPYEDGLLSYPEHSTYTPPDAKLANQWKRKCTQEELGLIEARIGPLLASAGYEPSGAPLAPLGLWQMLRLRVQNRSFIWRLMISRYGVVGPVTRGLGRRLGIPKLRDFGANRIDTIHQNYLK